MADEFLDTMFTDTAPAEEVAPVQEQEAAVEPAPETVTEPAQKQPEAVEPAPQPDRSGYVPIDAMLTEREKRQAAERRIAEFEAQQARQTPQDTPDPFDDPAGYQRHFEAQLDQRLQAQRADMSYQFAVREHGKDKVEEARAWAMEKAKSDPVFNQQVGAVFQTEASPVDWVVQQHQRDTLLTQIGDPTKLDDWFEQEAAKRGFARASAPPVAAPVAVVQTPAPTRTAPPRSIAADASPTSAKEPAAPANFGDIFKR